MPRPNPDDRFFTVPIGDVLDEYAIPSKNQGLVAAQNVVYRRSGGYGKRTGSGPYGGHASGLPGPVISGYRWSRGVPTAVKQMLVQSSDGLYLGNDNTGAFTGVGGLAAGSTPAFFASANDAQESFVTGMPASDIAIIAYGSGAPKKWDGTNLTPLSSAITNPFLGCETFHEHVWFWGDPAYPDIVYATDLDNPEAYTFAQAFGGYRIGKGDGDARVQRCLKVGGSLLVWKTRGIWAISGYDFVQGDVQFQVQPLVTGIGTTAPHTCAVLRNAAVWWSGQDFYRMSPTDAAPEPIGSPIIRTIAKAAQNNQSVMRAVAGDFLVSGIGGPTVYNGFYICAIDGGSGTADTLLVYDDYESARRGKPAWTVWTGPKVGSFIPWGGPGDQSLLFYGDALSGQVWQLGANATADVSAANVSQAIPTSLQTGRFDAGSPNRKKHLSRFFIDAEANAATFNINVTSDLASAAGVIAPTGQQQQGAVWGNFAWGTATFGSSSSTTYQSSEAAIDPRLPGYNHTILITESSPTSAWEIVNMEYEVVEESYRL